MRASTALAVEIAIACLMALSCAWTAAKAQEPPREDCGSMLVQVSPKLGPLTSVRDSLLKYGLIESEDSVTIVPFDVVPELANREAVKRALIRNYPQELKDQGTGGTALIIMLIAEDGGVVRARVMRSSGFMQLDAGALAVANSMTFTRGKYHGCPAQTLASMPVLFRSSP